MLNRLNSNEFFDQDELRPHYDAHIRAYESEKMGIQVVFCDSKGIPVSESMAPMSSYFPNTSHNM